MNEKTVFWVVGLLSLILMITVLVNAKTYLDPGSCDLFYDKNNISIEVCGRSCQSCPDAICDVSCPPILIPECPSLNSTCSLKCESPIINQSCSLFGNLFKKKDNNDATDNIAVNSNNSYNDYIWWAIGIGIIILIAWRYNWFRYLTRGGREIKESYKGDYTNIKEQTKEKYDDIKEDWKEKLGVGKNGKY